MIKEKLVNVKWNKITITTGCMDESAECKRDGTQLLSIKIKAVSEEALAPTKIDLNYKGKPCFEDDPLNCIFSENELVRVKDCPQLVKLPFDAVVAEAQCH
eukprot:CAMPEP_0116991990 /NCGR_PEP_ID=MMETSP0467-20121206/66499_1 /TAXON_ID=283647 /ORGANISM="Mesodinium pulex, Strain SPMC105" /LENGTH=100 /DNA_ID=CAMNT_0004689243 /DNA_START=206 /DNA_END=508 /DNA_ORIENTATION=+